MASIKPEDLADAIQQQLTIYGQKVSENCYAAGAKAVKALVDRTKPTAPALRGDFRRAIASKELERSVRGFRFAWYVKKPHYRKTHLLVRGHAKQNGGRVQGDPFLDNAMSEVLPAFEKDMEDALKHDS
jgi:hypothetical protein